MNLVDPRSPGFRTPLSVTQNTPVDDVVVVEEHSVIIPSAEGTVITEKDGAAEEIVVVQESTMKQWQAPEISSEASASPVLVAIASSAVPSPASGMPFFYFISL